MFHLVEIVTIVTTVMFFLGTLTMMYGAYRVTLSFGDGPGPVQRGLQKAMDLTKGPRK
jgi:hypothetical protein